MTHDWKSDNTVGKEVVIDTGKIYASSHLELQCRLSLDAQTVGIFDDVQELLIALLDDLMLRLEMSQNGRWLCYRSGRGDIIDRSIMRQQAFAGLCQELLVSCA